jgi:hypothetical protein
MSVDGIAPIANLRSPRLTSQVPCVNLGTATTVRDCQSRGARGEADVCLDDEGELRDMAEAGGKDPVQLDAAISQVVDIVGGTL